MYMWQRAWNQANQFYFWLDDTIFEANTQHSNWCTMRAKDKLITYNIKVRIALKYEPNAIRSLYVLGSLLIGWKGQELNGTCMSEASDVSD